MTPRIILFVFFMKRCEIILNIMRTSMNSRHLVVAVFSLQEGTKDKQEECCSAPFWVRFLVLI